MDLNRRDPNAWRSLVPEHGQEIALLDIPRDDERVHIVLLWPGEVLKPYTGLLVEMWNHKNFGRGKRAWQAEFDEAERKKLSTLHAKAYGWCMRTGHPAHTQMAISTYYLLVRAANLLSTL